MLKVNCMGSYRSFFWINYRIFEAPNDMIFSCMGLYQGPFSMAEKAIFLWGT